MALLSPNYWVLHLQQCRPEIILNTPKYYVQYVITTVKWGKEKETETSCNFRYLLGVIGYLMKEKEVIKNFNTNGTFEIDIGC
jgi:hypothetical protein